jgi:uncharacterized BrkB/YihY/UPF0761 family membrane protein
MEEKKDINIQINEINSTKKISDEMLWIEHKKRRIISLMMYISYFIIFFFLIILFVIISLEKNVNFLQFVITISLNFSIIKSFLGLFISFIIGILAFYFKNKKYLNKKEFDQVEFIKETYINRIDSSNFNPQKGNYL